MKFAEAVVSFSEIPGEISLCINISNCPIKCPGCHSKHLWEDIGLVLTEAKLSDLIDSNPGITCVAFMGGDSNPARINTLCQYVKDEYDLKTAWYSGRNTLSKKVQIQNLDFLKLGPYREDRGGLDKEGTNQHLYVIIQVTSGLPVYIQKDITYKLQRNEDICKSS